MSQSALWKLLVWRMLRRSARQVMPMARPGVSPGDFVAFLTLEVCVGHTQTVVAAQLQQSLSILVHPAYAMVAETGGPGVAVGSHSSIEVS